MPERRLSAASAGPGVAAPVVLIVEDEPMVRELVVFELEDAGFAVLESASAEDGLTILERQPVAALFTDIRLAGPMDGWRLAEAARLHNPSLPVIYATGYSSEAPRVVPGGVFLRKPYLPSTVIETIERLIGSARAKEG